MRLLLVHRYFWPDTPPYASMLRSMGANWSAVGHEVSVFTAQPSYKPELENQQQLSRDCVDGIDVTRCWLLRNNGRIASVLNSFLFVIQLIWFIGISRKFDVVIMSTVPQVLGAWSASLATVLSKSRFVYHMQDIHPEGAMYCGIIKSPTIVRFLKALDLQTCRRSSAVVVLSNDMKSTLLQRDLRFEKKIRIIKNHPMNDYTSKNCVLKSEPNCVRENKEKYLLGNKAQDGGYTSTSKPLFRVVFAGNIGQFQGLETVVEAGLRLKDNAQLRIVFVGDGKCRRVLEERSRPAGNVIEFTGHKSVHETDEIIAEANLALISLAPNIHRVAFPSKILSYAKLGVPLLVVVESDSELATLVRDWNMGICVKVGDAEDLTRQLLSVLSEPKRIEVLSENVKLFGLHTFDIDQINSQWHELLAGI